MDVGFLTSPVGMIGVGIVVVAWYVLGRIGKGK